MFGKKTPALRQGYRVREDAIDLVQLSSGNRNQVMTDTQQGLPHDCDVLGQHEIEMLGNRSGQRVFDGNNGGIHFPATERAKSLGREGKGHDPGFLAHLGCEPGGSLMAE